MSSPVRALALVGRHQFAGIYVEAEYFGEAIHVGQLVQKGRILQGMPDGVVLLDRESTIIWGNGRLGEWSGRENVVGENFYRVLGNPEIIGPDFSPLNTALATQSSCTSTLRASEPTHVDGRLA